MDKNIEVTSIKPNSKEHLTELIEEAFNSAVNDKNNNVHVLVIHPRADINPMQSLLDYCHPKEKKEMKKIDREKIKSLKKAFFNESSFDKYISSLPKYCKRSLSKYEQYIIDYMKRNRSAKLRDIVHGCREYGIKVDAHDPSSVFYKSLKNLIKSGQVTKQEDVYVWNYNE